MAQDSDQWWALVNKVMYLRVLQKEFAYYALASAKSVVPRVD
jgi:hypothetical protein